MSRLTVVKNAFANLCRGGATAFVTLLLPPFLTRILSQDAYGTWLLILQLGTYVSLFDFGVQTAVGRFVAHCNELGDTKQRDSIVSTAISILASVGLLAIVGISILAWQLPHLFKDMPAELHQDAQLALLIVGGSLCVSLPFTVFGAIFIGLQRYDIPAWIIGTSKLLGGIFVVIVAHSSHSIVMMAIVMGATNLFVGFWQFVAYKKMAGHILVSIRLLSKAAAIDIMQYCSSLVVWTIGGILVTSLDGVIIGYFDYKSLAYYALAASLTTFIVGIQGSVFSSILPNAAALGAREDREGLGELLISTTRYAVIILIITSLPLIICTKPILAVWVGTNYAIHTAQLLQLLVVANFIRQLAGPYAMIAMAVGEQKKIVLSPIIEGIINVTISILVTKQIGVIGVAIGTMIGGTISVVSHFLYNLPRTKSIYVPHVKYVFHAILKPLISVLPGTAYMLLFTNQDNYKFDAFSIFSLALVSILTMYMLYVFGMTQVEKQKCIMLLKRKLNLARSSN
jgi:O-antigen/teichoic acid export membrane protein